MTNHEKISVWQLAILLSLSRILQFFLFSPRRIQTGPITFCLLLPIAAALTGLLLLPVGRLMAACPGRDIVFAAQQHCGRRGLLLPAAFLMIFLSATVQTLSGFSAFLTASAYPDRSPWLFILLLSAAAGYAAFMGPEPTARFGFFVFFAFLAAVVFVGIGLLSSLQGEALLPPAYDRAKDAVRLFASLCLGNAELVLLPMLVPSTGKTLRSVFLRWNLLWVPILSAAVLFTAAALGDYSAGQRYPFFTVTKVAQIPFFQRTDSLHIALWVFLAVLRLSLFCLAAAKCLAPFLPEKGRPYGGWICAAAAALIAGIASTIPGFLDRLSDLLSAGLPGLICTGVPAVLLLGRRKGGKP